MRHLHFTQSLEPLQGAGLGYSALGLHEGMTSAGLTSKLVTTRAPNFTGCWPGVKVYQRFGPERLFFAPSMVVDARGMVGRSDVVHGHGFYVSTNWIIGSKARHQDKKLVYHPQGFLDPWILSRSRWKKRLAHTLFEDRNFRHARLWRAVSVKEESQIRAFGIKAPIVVVPNGVSLPTPFSQAELSIMSARFPKQKPRRAIFLSRIHPKKGLDLLIPAWARIAQSIRNNWELLIFGPDEGGYAARVKKWIEEENFTDTVRLMGTVSGVDKRAAYCGADLFILPSYSEGFPMAVLEAASYGVPVVQTDECNFSALTRYGGAWEARPTEDSVYAKILEAMTCDDAERHQRGRLGLELVANHYSWESIATTLNQACLGL